MLLENISYKKGMGLSRNFANDFFRFQGDKHFHPIDKGNQF